MTNVAIVGGSGGIGQAVVEALSNASDVESIQATHFKSAAPAVHANVKWSQLDASDADAVANWMQGLGQVDWLINCAGFLHDKNNGPEKSISQFDAAHFNRNIQFNCLPTLLLATHAHKVLKNSSDPIFATISARVGSISDNQLGGWYSYRASKAALNMALKTLAIEYQRIAPAIKVLSLHPGTTDTALSKPFQKNVPSHKLFSAEKTATLLIAQLQEANQHPSGRFIAFDGTDIPW